MSQHPVSKISQVNNRPNENGKNFPEKKLTVVTVDFGEDCDDQTAIVNLIAGMEKNEELAFIVGGPQPKAAAAAIAQKYYEVTGKYPLIAVETQLEEELPLRNELLSEDENRIFSLMDGNPMASSFPSVNTRSFSLEKFQQKIDEKIISGTIEHFEQIILASLYDRKQYYNNADRLETDALLKKTWNTIPVKTSIMQFQFKDGKFDGFNYNNSNKQIADECIQRAFEQGEVAVVDGKVAKTEKFTLPILQPHAPGIQKAIEFYLENRQIPWLGLIGPNGSTPFPQQTHASIFMEEAKYPLMQHTSGTHGKGFGAQRALQEICNLLPLTDDHRNALKEISLEQHHFDEQVANALNDEVRKALREKFPDIGNDAARMKNYLHNALMDTVTNFAREKGIITQKQQLDCISQLYTKAKEAGREEEINPSKSMQEIQESLLRYPLIKDIKETIEIQKDIPGKNGETYVKTMLTKLREIGASAIVYDAVAVQYSRALLRNPEAKPFFQTKSNKLLNITPEAVEKMKEEEPALLQRIEKEAIDGLQKGRIQTNSATEKVASLYRVESQGLMRR